MKNRSLFPDFGGVFLADILANGIAIIIILILIVVSSGHDKEVQRLEQVEDMSVLLSRDISTSVVMNALPTSPPVRLHHYDRDVLDRRPDERIMPILELHTDYVRNYYDGKTISSRDLLEADNALDRYLQLLGRQRLENLRVDVYSIRLFYVAMSIFKAHGHWPRHWHFLGYGEEGLQLHDEGQWVAELSKEAENEESVPKEEQEENLWGDISPGGGDVIGADDGVQESGDPGWSLAIPDDLETDLPPSEFGTAYPFDGQRPFGESESGGKGEETDISNLPAGSMAESEVERERLGDSMFSAFSEVMRGNFERGKRSGQDAINRIQLRVASPARVDPEDQPTLVLNVNFDFYSLLVALFGYMQTIQDEADSASHTRLPEYDVKSDLLPLVTSPPVLSSTEVTFFAKLYQSLSGEPPEDQETITLEAKMQEGIGQNFLALQPNQLLHKAVILQSSSQNVSAFLPKEVGLRVRVGLYPEIYSGLELPIKENTLLLMPTQQKNPRELRWRVLTVVNPQRNDFVTAFVYAAIAPSGQLLLATEENFIYSSDAELATKYPISSLRNEQWTTFAYGGASLLLLLGSVFGFWRSFA